MTETTSTLPEAFLEFLKTARFYGTSLGDSLRVLRERFGPESESREFPELPGDPPPGGQAGSYWKRWAALPAEFTFTGDLLWAISLDTYQGANAALLGPGEDVTPAGVAAYLARHNLTYRVRPPSEQQPLLEYLLPNGVALEFDEAPDEGIPLSLLSVEHVHSLLPFTHSAFV
ncbi:hypothetical protein [Deinococcus sp.]|uniref:hypothetical protein n=1 Tax=Deinococcus sp. TaxID=47478 RepID=UPI003C7ED227